MIYEFMDSHGNTAEAVVNTPDDDVYVTGLLDEHGDGVWYSSPARFAAKWANENRITIKAKRNELAAA